VALTRRDVIKAGVFAGAAMSLPLSRVVSGQSALASRMPASKLPKPFMTPFVRPPVAVPVRSDETADFYSMHMNPIYTEIVPGYQTLMFGYEGSVPGPTIKVSQGRPALVRHCNTLPTSHPTYGYEPWTSVHLHGSASLPQFDGYASDITRPNQFKDYIYPNVQPARTLWYHDHGLHHTAENVYHGLYGQYHMSDPLEDSLPIPKGVYDVPLMICDAMFKTDGQLLFTLEDDAGMWGDVILVNGRPWPVMQVERRKYRFRILGASVSRSYRFALDSGDTMAIIATDGGLMPKPQHVKSFRAASSERYDVIIDFSKYPIGRRIVLQNLSNPNNRDYTNTNKVMAFDVVSAATDLSNNSIPAVLNPDDATMALQASDAVRTRKFEFHRNNSEWKINNKSWKDVVNSNYTFTLASPNRGDVEIWEFKNASGGWFHPVHVHLIDFKILTRNGKAPMAHELGPKDVVYVGENETVQVITRFEGCGKYMIHCHNLIHEDHDMMGQFEVIDPYDTGYDPLGEPCHWLADEWEYPL
jgi:FtsP/CotA-like multicopper oxidase with cupredoxin domain